MFSCSSVNNVHLWLLCLYARSVKLINMNDIKTGTRCLTFELSMNCQRKATKDQDTQNTHRHSNATKDQPTKVQLCLRHLLQSLSDYYSRC